MTSAASSRVWSGSGRSTTDPESACSGWPGPYRRQGLARALLASALAPIDERGVPEVMAEVDASNAAGLALMRGIGALETGSSVVLLRRATPTSDGR